MTDTLQSGAESAVDLDKLEALACAANEEAEARGEWFNLYQIADGITLDASAALVAAANPVAVLDLIALARRATAPHAGPAPTGREMLTLRAANDWIRQQGAHRVADGVDKVLDRLATHPAEPVGAQTEWTCFHCEESFTDLEKARLHFGKTERQSPACQLDAAHLRELEAELQKYREEDTELHHQIAGLAARTESAKRRAEEEGYALGLKDAHLVGPAVGSALVAIPRQLLEDVTGGSDILRDCAMHALRSMTCDGPPAGELVAIPRVLMVTPNDAYSVSVTCDKVMSEADLEAIRTRLSAPTGALASESAAAPADQYKCIGKGGVYELIASVAKPAGTLRDLLHNFLTVYRDTADGEVYVRMAGDFAERMKKLATHQPSTQAEGKQ